MNKIILVLLVLLASVSIASAYDITGQILDGTTGISGATVSVNATSTTTNATGNYTLTGLANGTHTVSATATNYNANSTSTSINGSSVSNVIILMDAVTSIGQIVQSMTDIGSIIDSLGVIWSALVNMIIGLMPLMIVLAVIGFVLGIFAVILDKIKVGGWGKS